ncbi:TetR family transcriptional regulator [Pseudonocardia sp. CNS-139]|nr:TetR family transcriptional regulator [Pseudonocardia sp. CNS-139]
MSTRRDDLLDAAIGLLGEQGLRALTHRAVDAAAGLPAGSATNHFSTRDALLEGITERIVVRERAIWDDIAGAACPTTAAELAAAMITLARAATGPNLALTRARYAILLEAGRLPQLRDRLLALGAKVDASFTTWMRIAGSPEPLRDAPLVMNHWTGVVLHQLSVPDPAFAAAGQITDLMETLEASWTATPPRTRSGGRSTRGG